jgi:hypothetical protein
MKYCILPGAIASFSFAMIEPWSITLLSLAVLIPVCFAIFFVRHRGQKQGIVDNVKTDVTNFFAARGVTVTSIGMFGGMTYENPEIQKAIDATFIAQQLKVVSEAKFEAQKKENERIELEANAVAEKARREAAGIADAKKVAAEAEAESIRKVTQALNEAQNPVLYQLKALEVEKARVEKWDGRYPTWLMGAAGTSPNLLLQVPPPGSAAAH